MIYAALTIACILLLAICMNTMASGYRKGPDEDDGFWEVYNLSWRVNNLITLCLLVITILWLPTTIAFSKIMLATMADVTFFRDDLPKLDGCIDSYNIKEAIDQAQDLTSDQLVMHYIQVAFQSLTIVFAVMNIVSAISRRFIDNREAYEEEYTTQMSRLGADERSEEDESDDSNTKPLSSNSER